MNSRTKIAGLLIAAALIVTAGIWLKNMSDTPSPAPGGNAPSSSALATGPETTTAIAPRPQPPTMAQTPATDSTPAPTLSTNTPVAPVVAAAPITEWEQKIDDALKSGGEDKDVAKHLIEIFPRLPTDGQVEAVQHISNLLPDEDYASLGKLMEDAKLPEEVLDQLIMDLLNRPNKIMLPELVKVARNAEHPKAAEAKDFLELYLEDDYGTDWNLWQTKVTEWLAANPD